jgi:hypothetical protein
LQRLMLYTFVCLQSCGQDIRYEPFVVLVVGH